MSFIMLFYMVNLMQLIDETPVAKTARFIIINSFKKRI